MTLILVYFIHSLFITNNAYLQQTLCNIGAGDRAAKGILDATVFPGDTETPDPRDPRDRRDSSTDMMYVCTTTHCIYSIEIEATSVSTLTIADISSYANK